MSLETSRGFTYRWMVGEREQGVTQALVEQELSSLKMKKRRRVKFL